MTEDKELHALSEFSGSADVLSIYMDTFLAYQTKDTLKLMFREALKRLGKEPNSKDVEAVTRFLDLEYDWQSRGLAMFSSGKELWKTIPLPVSVRTRAYLSAKPYVRTLMDVLDRVGRYCIALLDHQDARLFLVDRGVIVPEAELAGDGIKRHRQAGWSEKQFQNRTENTAEHNLKQSIAALEDLCTRTDCKRVMLAGSDEILSGVQNLLPDQLRRKVVAVFVADMEIAPRELLNMSLDVAARVDLEEEQKLVDQAITTAAKGGAATIGLADTLYQLYQGRVHELLVAEDLQAEGYVCTRCGYLATVRSTPCPLCGYDEMVATPDVVNLAIAKAIETGARVNVVRENAKLVAAGGVAALMRY
jgi:peptide chain release factor subunit 1